MAVAAATVGPCIACIKQQALLLVFTSAMHFNALTSLVTYVYPDGFSNSGRWLLHFAGTDEIPVKNSWETYNSWETLEK